MLRIFEWWLVPEISRGKLGPILKVQASQKETSSSANKFSP